MSASAIAPEKSALDLLPGSTFADAFDIDVDEPALDASRAAQRIMGSMPRWIGPLLSIRDAVVGPFGLKRRTDASALAVDRIGRAG